MTDNNYSYRITIEANDHGKRQYQESLDFNSQSDMRTALAFAIVRGLEACFNDPPNPIDICLAACSLRVHTQDLLTGLAFAHDAWDTCNDFEDAVSVVVDVDKLASDEPEEERARIANRLSRYGIEIKGNAE